MLLYFKVSNSRSFEKEAELSMISTEVDESSTNSIYNKKYNINILKFASIFGANASGKSNLLKALAEATIMIQESHTYSKNKTNQLKYFPNKTNLKNLNEPTFYKIGFLINNNHFEYSFSNTSERIEKETLIEFKENETEIIHFNRVYIKKKNRYIWTEMSKPFKDKFHFIDPFIKKENLFLSVVSQLSENKEYKIQIADDIYSFLDERIKGDIELKKLWKNEIYLVLTQILKTKQKEKLLKLLEQADFTIKDIIREKKIGNESFKFYTFHSIENEDKKELIKYNLEEESTGTLQFIAWVGYLLFTENKILIIDELDNHMHPHLTEYLLSVFQQRNSQLIFTTHDVKLMNNQNISNDQKWIVDKDEIGNSKIYPLSNYDIDDDKMIDNVYLDGFLGGIPSIKNN